MFRKGSQPPCMSILSCSIRHATAAFLAAGTDPEMSVFCHSSSIVLYTKVSSNGCKPLPSSLQATGSTPQLSSRPTACKHRSSNFWSQAAGMRLNSNSPTRWRVLVNISAEHWKQPICYLYMHVILYSTCRASNAAVTAGIGTVPVIRSSKEDNVLAHENSSV